MPRTCHRSPTEPGDVFDEWTNAIVGYRICHGKMFENLKIFEAFAIFEAMENESICSDRTQCHGQVRLS